MLTTALLLSAYDGYRYSPLHSSVDCVSVLSEVNKQGV